MRYRAISLENDQRRAHFAYFSTMQNPYVGLTAEVEAGAILGACHRNGWPFSLAMVWCTGRAANAVPPQRLASPERGGGICEANDGEVNGRAMPAPTRCSGRRKKSGPRESAGRLQC